MKLETENFKNFFELIDKKDFDLSIRNDLFDAITKLEDYAKKSEQEIEENLGNISSEIRNFLEIFLNHLIIEKGRFKSLDLEEVGYLGNISNFMKIKFLRENGLDRNISDNLYFINSFSNIGVHYINNSKNELKSQLITALSYVWSVFHWFFDQKTKNNFISNKYYFATKNKERKANIEIKQSFFFKPYKEIVVNNEKLINILFDNSLEFFIPIYQRDFSWTENEINDLIYDLEKRIKDRKEHFFGSVSFVKGKEVKGRNGKIITQLKIVDGQQRFTTIILFLKCIYLKYLEINNRDESKIDSKISNFINNNRLPITKLEDNLSMSIFKIIWREKIITENIILMDLEENHSFLKKVRENQLFKIFKFINNKVKNLSLNELDDLYRSIENLIIGINWTQGYNEFELFESINSKGKLLTNFDILKNYMMSLMKDEIEDLRGEEIIKIFNSSTDKIKWIPSNKREEITDKIIEKYIQLNGSGIKLNKKRIFTQFKDLFSTYLKTKLDKVDNLNLDEFKQIMLDFGKFIHAVLLTNSGDKKIWLKSIYLKDFFNDFFSLIGASSYASILIPYFIDDKNFEFSEENGTIMKPKDPIEFRKILKFLEVWRVRGEIVFSNDNIAIYLSNFIIDLLSNLEKNKNESFYKTLKELVENKNDILSLPTKEEFNKILSVAPIRNSKVINVIFSRIMNEKDNINFMEENKYNIFQIIDSDFYKRTKYWKELFKDFSTEDNEIFFLIGNYFFHENSNKMKNIKEDLENLINTVMDNNITTNLDESFNTSSINKIKSYIKIDEKNKLKDNIKHYMYKRSKEFANLASEIFIIDEEKE